MNNPFLKTWKKQARKRDQKADLKEEGGPRTTNACPLYLYTDLKSESDKMKVFDVYNKDYLYYTIQQLEELFEIENQWDKDPGKMREMLKEKKTCF